MASKLAPLSQELSCLCWLPRARNCAAGVGSHEPVASNRAACVGSHEPEIELQELAPMSQ